MTYPVHKRHSKIRWYVDDQCTRGSPVTRVAELCAAAKHFGHTFVHDLFARNPVATPPRKYEQMTHALQNDTEPAANLYLGSIPGLMAELRDPLGSPFLWLLGARGFFNFSFMASFAKEHGLLYNEHYTLLSKAELERTFPVVCSLHRSRIPNIFARSDSGWKILEGKTRSPGLLLSDLDQGRQQGVIDRDTLLVLADDMPPSDEVRVLMNGRNGKAVAGSVYRLHGEAERYPGACPQAIDVAEEFHRLLAKAGVNTPALYYIDLATTMTTWKVLELSCFHTACMYDMDPWPVVEAVHVLNENNLLHDLPPN